MQKADVATLTFIISILDVSFGCRALPPGEKCTYDCWNRNWNDKTIFFKQMLDWWNNSLLTRSWTGERNLCCV